ncbi:transposase [Candidatus Saccharibacteria bacterium]|nr:MAG: transposase [Candidatus Saccharibacteria bacterium]
MPSRNVVREFETGAYYHVYNRGVEKRIIFSDDQDYTVFLGLLKKYLANDRRDANKNNRHRFPSLESEVALLAYCLMPNHFHLLVYQMTESGVEKLMRRVSTGYVMYFNEKYNRVGSLFQGPYKASRITSDAYLYHISRYIHLNPDAYAVWPYSSYKYYAKGEEPKWLRSDRVLDLFGDRQEYLSFVAEYVDQQRELEDLKWQLANDVTRDEM